MTPTLWTCEPHTRAKHQVLRAYLDAWIPIMAQQALRVRARRPGGSPPRLLLVDGFAGPGRYAEGEQGSPLIMLEALLAHHAFARLQGVEFLFLFIEQDRARVEHLRGEIEALGPFPENVKVRVALGDFAPVFGSVIDRVTEDGLRLVPTFAFIDPFGYSNTPMSLTGRLVEFPRSEVLVFLPLSYLHRFVGRKQQDRAFNALYDSDEWRDAISLKGDARRDYLLDLFERRLASKGRIEFVRSFQLRTQDGNDYRLVFGTGHRRGLEAAKEAMWKVDPERGTSYVAMTESGQEVLFSPGESVDTTPLLTDLREHFGRRWFTIDEAEDFTLLHTPFLPRRHLKRRTLTPAERGGMLEVERPSGARRSGFRNARLRFP